MEGKFIGKLYCGPRVLGPSQKERKRKAKIGKYELMFVETENNKEEQKYCIVPVLGTDWKRVKWQKHISMRYGSFESCIEELEAIKKRHEAKNINLNYFEVDVKEIYK